MGENNDYCVGLRSVCTSLGGRACCSMHVEEGRVVCIPINRQN